MGLAIVRRHNIVLAAGVALVLVVVLYTSGSLDNGQYMRILPAKSSQGASEVQVAHVPNDSTSQHGTSRLHFLVPASVSNVRLCYALASAAVNRYPVPTLIGWNGQGELDAARTHLAKLRTMKRYLDGLSPEEDEDLVIMVDGYDVIHQLPVEIMVKRYFDIAQRADAHLAERMGMSVRELHEQDVKQTVFWGPDKICWPGDAAAGRCWAVPPPYLGKNAFGEDQGAKDLRTNDPRWLNSGTVIAPIGDMRKVIDATMDEIAATHDVNFPQSESDQYYLANLWARQEYSRSKQIANGSEVEGGPANRVLPEKLSESQPTELHIAIEYESALFQTQAANEPFLGYLEYSGPSYTNQVHVDMFNQGEAFTPFPIHMPINVRMALAKLYDSIPKAHPGSSADTWIQKVQLATNLVTKHIYGLWHCTGAKDSIDSEFRKMWFYPFIRSLLRESVRSIQRGDAISPEPIDGRVWLAKSVYPKDGEVVGEYGGAWSDEEVGGKFIPWKDICGEHEGILFQGQQDAAL
ncbi:uncharacterized protein MAM_05427 [Metarhizium album ARSEF 1941]|uniref:Uncharacterized protein n=1 Tax=Metarhizium album (strain ARSEF 1941) TaxID=1081103 RepID=A0A0B2WLD1_METAS|nr:uncharacterized protein MAM_05427 [Metarhizium album ARSEF 1941]KHN96871.1 hypothetical protein MAM_05427 [Metarhizium album ARSEF 1941]